jgi:RHS Repeat
MAQIRKATDSIVLNNLKIINLATFEKNTLTAKVIDNEYHYIKYNSDGNPTEMLLKSNNQVEKTFSYDKLGRLVEMTYGNKFFYLYDAKSNLKSLSLDSIENIIEEFCYDINNNLIENKKLDSTGKLTTYQKFEYNKKNKIVKDELYDSDSKIKRNEINNKYLNDTLLFENEFSSFKMDGTLWFKTLRTHKYNNNSQILEITIEQDGKMIAFTEYHYDKNNILERSIEHNFDLSEKRQVIYTYSKSKLFRVRTMNYDSKKIGDKVVETLSSDTYIDYSYNKFGDNTAMIFKNSKLEEEGRMTWKFLQMADFDTNQSNQRRAKE